MNHYRETIGYKRRVLIVDDEIVNCEILGNILGDIYDVTYAHDGLKAYELLLTQWPRFSLVLLDLIMPTMDGFEFLKKLRSDNELKHIPVIVITTEKDAEVKSISLGAVDFISKPYNMPDVIRARCTRTIELSEDNRIISSVEKDSLTGLYSPDFFYLYVKQIDRYRSDIPMDAAAFNIEHFHLLNEMYGRNTGNKVLKDIAGMLIDIFNNEGGIGCRVDADMFYVYCRHRQSYDDIIAKIQDNLPELPEKAKIRVRMGVYPNVDKDIEAESRFDRAKLACDRIRGDYTKSFATYSEELHELSIYQERLINEIDEAIRNKDLLVYYQPKYSILGDRPVLKSAEALIRWKHPEMGMIATEKFIPLFESNGLIQKLDRYAWEVVAYQMYRWKQKHGRTIPVSVNMSRIDTYDPDLEGKLLRLIDAYELTTDDLMLEITESAYADDSDTFIKAIESLRSRGFKIEMDDFGTGYSSLSMLTTFDVDVIKIDMQFISNMLKDDTSLRMVELIIDIARFLNVVIVAEGVEEEAQVKKLKELGCDIIQGYYFSKPIPAEELELLIEAENRNCPV